MLIIVKIPSVQFVLDIKPYCFCQKKRISKSEWLYQTNCAYASSSEVLKDSADEGVIGLCGAYSDERTCNPLCKDINPSLNLVVGQILCPTCIEPIMAL